MIARLVLFFNNEKAITVQDFDPQHSYNFDCGDYPMTEDGQVFFVGFEYKPKLVYRTSTAPDTEIKFTDRTKPWNIEDIKWRK